MDVITITLLNSTATAFRPWKPGFMLAVDGNGACLRSYDISSRTMSVLAGSCENAGFADGTLTQARFDHPTDVAVRERDGSIFLADSGNCIIRWIRPGLDSVSTLAGTQGSQGMQNGPVESARFSNSMLLALINEDLMMAAPRDTKALSDCPSLLVADMGNSRLRSIKLDTECENPSTPPPPLPPPAPPPPRSSMSGCNCTAARWTARAEGALGMLATVLLACIFKWCVCRRRHYASSSSKSHDLPRDLSLAFGPLSQPLILDEVDPLCSTRRSHQSPAARSMFTLPCEVHPSPVPADNDPCGEFAPGSVSWAELIKRVTPKDSELREARQVFNEVRSACLKIEGAIAVELAGSLAKGTAVCETSDLDVVVLFSDFDPKEYERYLDRLPPALKELEFQEGQNAPIKSSQDSVHHYTFTLRLVRVDILVGGELPKDHPNCLSLLNEPSLAIRRAWRPSCTPKAVQFICEQADKQVYFRTTVRLAKYWRKNHVTKGEELGLSSTLLELLVAHALLVAERGSVPPHSIPAAFSAFLRLIKDEGSTLRATWGMDSDRTDTPLLLAGPHDPTNNVAGAVKDWKELSKCAVRTLELLYKLGVIHNWSAASTLD